MATRRSRVEIWTDILQEVQTAGDASPPSRIQTRVNLPYDRFWRHIEDLREMGLLERDLLRTSSEGQRFLAESAHLNDLLRGKHR